MIKQIKLEDIKYLFKKRNNDVNKGDFGKVGILGGSIKYSGAIKLANMSLASLKSGCGLVKIIVPSEVAICLIPNILEQTIYPYESLENIKDAIKDLDTLAIGMGWDNLDSYLEIMDYILKNYKGKLIIDADGLNALVEHLDLLKLSKAKIVLTPHLKEFSRLTNLSIKEIERNKTNICLNFAKENNVILLLKGHETIISDGVDTHLCVCGTPGMATSGSGDVLSGILAGMLAYNEYNLMTVSASVMLNGLAGDIAEESSTDISMLASDTISNISMAIKRIRNENTVTFDNFQKLDIRVGTIIKVEDFPKAKRPAFKLEIDFGNELGIKKSSAQITVLYTKEDLVGKQILAVVNFPKKQVADFMSEVLVLGVYTKDGVVLIEPNKDVNNGEKLG